MERSRPFGAIHCSVLARRRSVVATRYKGRSPQGNTLDGRKFTWCTPWHPPLRCIIVITSVTSSLMSHVVVSLKRSRVRREVKVTLRFAWVAGARPLHPPRRARRKNTGMVARHVPPLLVGIPSWGWATGRRQMIREFCPAPPN
eukprot:3374281-Prymnesium_polylepis.1